MKGMRSGVLVSIPMKVLKVCSVLQSYTQEDKLGSDSFYVHLKGEFSAERIKLLKDLVGESVRISSGELPEDRDFTILVCGRVTSEELGSCPSLTSVIIPWAGVPAVTLEAVRLHPGISLHNIHHNAASTSEMAVTLMLAAAKRIIPADIALRKNDWSPRYIPDEMIIEESRVLVLGWGSIGKRIGRICRAMGAEVKGISRSGSGDTFPPESLHSLLPETDILFVSVPSTESTKGLIGEKELSLLPEGSVLVNISRSDVVDERALYFSLKSGRLGSAGLDVWNNSPRSIASRTDTRPSAFPFGDLFNVVMSPHRGGAFGLESQEDRRIRDIASVIRGIVSGKQKTSIVDKDMGY